MSNPYDHSVTNVQSKLFLNSDEDDDYDDFVSIRRSIGAHLIRV